MGSEPGALATSALSVVLPGAGRRKLEVGRLEAGSSRQEASKLEKAASGLEWCAGWYQAPGTKEPSGSTREDDSDCRSKQATSRVSRRKTSRGASKAQHAILKDKEKSEHIE